MKVKFLQLKAERGMEIIMDLRKKQLRLQLKEGKIIIYKVQQIILQLLKSLNNKLIIVL